jgi:hypothetical protein
MTMVRAVSLAAVISAATTAGAIAQPVIGFRLGLSMSRASIESTEFVGDQAWLTAFAGGGYVRFGAGTIALQPELTYVTKGVRFEEQGLDEAVIIQVDYIEVPVLLFLGLGTAAATPYVVVGPALSFEVACSIDDPILGKEDCGDEGRKKMDVGAMFGAGLALPAGPGSIVVDGRFNLGLIDVTDDESDESFKHRALLFTAGYQIPLGIR